MAAKKGQTGRRAGSRRLALLGFGVLFVVLFLVIAVSQGLSQPSVPDGDVAFVENVPDDVGQISEKEFREAMLQAAIAGGQKKLPKEGSTKFKELRDSTLGELLNSIWIRGEAEEMGIKTPTAKQVADTLAKVKKENFPTDAAYEEFLESSKLTQEDVDKRIELNVLSEAVTERIKAGASIPSESQIADYYQAAKATQFTTKPSRDVRIITNKDKAEVEAAKAALEADDSAANWKKVAQKYSSDPTTKAKGGLQPGLTEELLASAGPFKDAIFSANPNELVGPVEFQGNFTLIEVIKEKQEKVQTLEEVQAQIASTLTQQEQESALNEFVAGWQSKWESRTFCAEAFMIEVCGNDKGDGRPSGADPACYEANPKKAPTACPAPVTPISPALPGSVSILAPKGEQFPQRPQPLPTAEETGEEPPEGLEAPPGE